MQVRQGLPRAMEWWWRGRDRSVTGTNTRLLYGDIAWFGVLFGVSANFLAVFVARLDPSPWLVSAVTSGPALVNILWQLQATRIVERSDDLQRLVVRNALPQRFGFLLIALIPLLLPRQWQAYGIVAIILLQGLPTAVMAVAFSTMFADLIPRDRMAAVVGMRNVLLGVTSTLVVMLSGVVLTWLPFPWGYQAILLLGFLASLGGVWCVARLRVERKPQPAVERKPDGTEMAPGALWRDSNFVRFAAGAGLLQLGMFMSAPLFPLLWVDTLHLSDGWISAFVTTLTFTGIVGSYSLRAFVHRWSISLILGASSLLFGLYPILASMLDQPLLIVAAAAFAGVWAGVINVVLFNGLTEVCPPAQRARYMGSYTWLMNIAIFSAPLAGAALAKLIGVQPALVIAGVLRMLAGAVFLWLPFVAWDRAAAAIHRASETKPARG